jgi:hypothetical protein
LWLQFKDWGLFYLAVKKIIIKLNKKKKHEIYKKDCILGRQKTAFGYIWSYKNITPLNIFKPIYQFDLNKNLINIFYSSKELKIWLKKNRPNLSSQNTVSSSIKKHIKNRIYKSGNHFYSLNNKI